MSKPEAIAMLKSLDAQIAEIESTIKAVSNQAREWLASKNTVRTGASA